MPSNLERHKGDFKKLVGLGDLMSADLTIQSFEQRGKLDQRSLELKKSVNEAFEKKYQKWYTESCALIRQMVPERLSEFEMLYKGQERRKQVDSMTYTIQDWFLGVRAVKRRTGEKAFDDLATMGMRFRRQVDILKSVETRFESSLFDIKQMVRADLFDSELESGRELHENGFLRAAGAVTGVVLETHLSQVCATHDIRTRKKNPTIADFNDMLKDNDVIDIPLWRFIQRLGDLRNLCDHKKEREPTAQEVLELIDGVEKTTKTLY